MQEVMSYRGYKGTIEYSLEDNILHGEVYYPMKEIHYKN